jgi:hypothetical protein
LSQAQRDLLEELGVQEANIVLQPGDAEANIVNALLRRGATISRWGIAMA